MMGLYNRLVNQAEPETWDANHNRDANPDKNMDWFSWHIAVHPFTDMVRLHVDGVFGTAQQAVDRMQSLFDLSQTEIDQLVEVWDNFVDDPDPDVARNNCERLQAYLRALERGIPQQLTQDVKGWLYGTLGITVPDDR